MMEMLAILADAYAAGGVGTDPGTDALIAGARKLSGYGLRPYFMLTLAMSGWLGVLEGAAQSASMEFSELIAQYAALIADERIEDQA